MIALGILLSLGLLLITILSVPIRVRFESNPVCYITWLFLKFRVRFVKGDVKTDVKIFNKKTRWFKKKKKPTKKKEPSAAKKEKKEKKEKKKKKQPKITKDLILGTLSDVAVKKSLRVILRFCRRCVNSVRISMLHCNIGLKDYYWQGILTGLFHSLPHTNNLQISGNFLEEKEFSLELQISILRIALALSLLLFTFPYLRAYSLYRRLYL